MQYNKELLKISLWWIGLYLLNITYASVVAQRATVCLPIVSSFSGEQLDHNITLWNEGDALIKSVADNCDNIITIFQSTGPVDMEVSFPQLTSAPTYKTKMG